MQRYKIWWVPFKAQRFPSLPRLKSRYLEWERIFLISSEKKLLKWFNFLNATSQLIWSQFYQHFMLSYKCKLSSFSLVTIGFVIYWCQNSSVKYTSKMLMKLTPAIFSWISSNKILLLANNLIFFPKMLMLN